MITLITGVPGSGKSMYAVKLILDAIKAKEDAIKRLPALEREGDPKKITECKSLIREIYTDIDGFDHDRFGTHVSPADWRDTPDGSLVVYDECQQRFGPDGQGRAKNPQIQALEKHRHSGHDIIFITQRERLLHAHVRDLVGRHYHIQRQYGTHNVKVFRRDETIDTKSKSSLNACDQFLWRYDKKLFDAYKSATVHTHKVSLPTWLKMSAFIVSVAVLAVGFFAYKSSSFWTGQNIADLTADATGISSASASVNRVSDPLTVEVNRGRRPLNGCVVWAGGTECRCHDIDGRVADWLDFPSCVRAAHGSTLNFHSAIIRDDGRRGQKPAAEARSAGTAPAPDPKNVM